jgi:hypothetical protein
MDLGLTGVTVLSISAIQPAAQPAVEVKRAMGRIVKEKSQMTAGDFKGGLRKAGFAVENGRIVDVSGKCPGFAVMPTLLSNGSVDRNATLANVIRERDAEIERRAAGS